MEPLDDHRPARKIRDAPAFQLESGSSGDKPDWMRSVGEFEAMNEIY